MKKKISLAIVIFILGWSAAVGYLSWRYEFNFSPWQGKDADVIKLTSSVFVMQCVSENNKLINEVERGGKPLSAFNVVYFSCISDRAESLRSKLSLTVNEYNYLGCIEKAESEIWSGEKCNKVINE